VAEPSEPTNIARRFRHLPMCFGCGADNDASLGLQIAVDAGRVRSTITLDEHYVGAPGLVHGGILTTLLDEVMGAVPLPAEAAALPTAGAGAGACDGDQRTSTAPRVTASLDVRFRAPVELGRELLVEAELGESTARDCTVRGTIRYADRPGAPRVVGTARYVVLQPTRSVPT
jgi:acyl-coenzyme A thioesterase PaaI-like protein